MNAGREPVFAAHPVFVCIRFTRRVPTIHLGWHHPFEGEKRLTTLCGQTGLTTLDDSGERVCATCERMAGDSYRAENSQEPSDARAEYVTVVEEFAADADDTELSRAVAGLRSQTTRVGVLLARRRETYKDGARA